MANKVVNLCLTTIPFNPESRPSFPTNWQREILRGLNYNTCLYADGEFRGSFGKKQSPTSRISSIQIKRAATLKVTALIFIFIFAIFYL